MFYFVFGDENVTICVVCEEKQWFLTIDKTSEFGNQFYSLLKNKKSLTKEAGLYPNIAVIRFEPDEISQLQFPSKSFECKPGDIFYIFDEGNSEIDIFHRKPDGGCFGLRVGEIEGSSVEDFKSFIQGKFNDGDNGLGSALYFTFSIKEPLDLKIVTTIIWLLLLLPLLFLVYFIFK